MPMLLYTYKHSNELTDMQIIILSIIVIAIIALSTFLIYKAIKMK